MHGSGKPILILQTGTALASVRARHGDFPEHFRRAMGLSRAQVRVHDARTTPLSQLASYHFAGAVITGSGHMVSDREDWSERSAEWLARAHMQGLPMFGVCYGHQLLAHALGGEVAFNPKGREMGTQVVSLHSAASSDPLFQHLPAALPSHTTHLQTVIRAPAQAQVLARSALDDCQAMRIGERTWGTQFHPEFSVAVMRGYIAARAADLHREGHCPVTLTRKVRATGLARGLLRRFVRFCRDAAF